MRIRRCRRLSGAAWVICLTAVVAGAAAGQPAGSGPCGAAVAQQRRIWRVVPPARPQPRDGELELWHWPTTRLGVWVAEAQWPGGARLIRLTPAAASLMEWSPTCAVTASERPRPAAAAPRFSDRDLAAAIDRAPRGVIYAWSPHMPLSVDGYRAIAQAAAARGLPVEVVLDPAADRAFAAAEVTRGRLPAAALRVSDSVELLFRDVHVHAPAAQLWAGGRLAGSALPGFHTAAEYGAFLDRAGAEVAAAR